MRVRLTLTALDQVRLPTRWTMQDVCAMLGIPWDVITAVRWQEGPVIAPCVLEIDLTTRQAAAQHAAWMARARRFADPVALAAAAIRGEV
jgi:hypothetical protein